MSTWRDCVRDMRERLRGLINMVKNSERVGKIYRSVAKGQRYDIGLDAHHIADFRRVPPSHFNAQPKVDGDHLDTATAQLVGPSTRTAAGIDSYLPTR
jgi:hypothetical protein